MFYKVTTEITAKTFRIISADSAHIAAEQASIIDGTENDDIYERHIYVTPLIELNEVEGVGMSISKCIQKGLGYKFADIKQNRNGFSIIVDDRTEFVTNNEAATILEQYFKGRFSEYQNKRIGSININNTEDNH